MIEGPEFEAPEQSCSEISFQAGRVFTPGSPVNEKDLFAGRLDQSTRIVDAVSQRGYHAVLYGERGVGKTSLANILSEMLTGSGRWIIPRVTCDASDDFSSLWRKAFGEVVVNQKLAGLGFGAPPKAQTYTIADTLPENLNPHLVRSTLEKLSQGHLVLVIFDEFDRLSERNTSVLMADTIKSLSDSGVDATICLIGVADSVSELIHSHESIERALMQIPMPRMSSSEIRQIIANGLTRLGMAMADKALWEIVSLSQGLPYITHLIALHSVRHALADDRRRVEYLDVDAGIRKSLDQWQQSTRNAYYEAVRSQQPGHIFREVLLSCALAHVDDMGFFTASSVRSPLRVIANRDYDIPNFARHLKELSEKSRGGMLERVGEKRKIRYRFVSPIMRPYIVMRGFADQLLTRGQLEKIQQGAEQ